MNLSNQIAESQTTAPFISAMVASIDANDPSLYYLSTPGRDNPFPARTVTDDQFMVGDFVTVHIDPGYLSPTILGDSPGATG